MPSTQLAALPYPSLSDAPNVPLHLQQLAEALDPRLVLTFPTEADRDAAVPATPAAGTTCWITDHGGLCVYEGTSWRYLPRGRIDSDRQTTTSPDVTTTPVAVNAVTFTNPARFRRYLIHWHGTLSSSADTNTLAVTIKWKAGTSVPPDSPTIGAATFTVPTRTYHCPVTLHAELTGAPAGPVRVAAYLYRLAGTGTAAALGGDTDDRALVIEDLGA